MELHIETKVRPVRVRGVELGTGRPKIILPILGPSRTELLREARRVTELPADLVEWRLDWYDRLGDWEDLLETARQLREVLEEMPLLATFRTAREGGCRSLPESDYRELIETLAESGLVDLLDIELFSGDELVRELVDFCHSRGVLAVVSSHDFDHTPPQEELVERLRRMEALGADLSKLAVMPRSSEDVLTLRGATREMHRHWATRPLITMSMGPLGTVSRITGEVFGSAATFGSAGKASAPGQLPAEKLANMLDTLHESF